MGVIRDIASQFKQVLALSANISTNTTTNGNGMDTADFEMGLAFFAMGVGYSDGTYVVSFEESDTGDFTGEETAVSSDNIIGDVSDLAVTASVSVGDKLGKVGLFGTKRYVRPVIVSTGVTTGITSYNILAVQAGESVPVA